MCVFFFFIHIINLKRRPDCGCLQQLSAAGIIMIAYVNVNLALRNYHNEGWFPRFVVFYLILSSK